MMAETAAFVNRYSDLREPGTRSEARKKGVPFRARLDSQLSREY
jgi:hypothetical protein